MTIAGMMPKSTKPTSRLKVNDTAQMKFDRENPIAFCKRFWPHIDLYTPQREIFYSLRDNRITVVPAGNMLGKDFVAGLAVLHFFLTRKPCRILTTSAKDDHLRVLWGEIHRFINESVIPIDSTRGGPIHILGRELRKIDPANRETLALNYVIGQVANPQNEAALQGHHDPIRDPLIPRTLFVGDEASSLADMYYTMCSTWATRMLIIGNTWDCRNFFYKAIEGDPENNDPGGDLKNEIGKGYYRKVIRIKAEDSPNVQFAKSQEEKGLPVTGEMILPGVLPYDEYLTRRKYWEKPRQCVSLDAEFYKGVENLLFPPDWLDIAQKRAKEIPPEAHRKLEKYLGIDPAEGGDSSAFSVITQLGLVEQVSIKTPVTTDVIVKAMALMARYNIKPENVAFDRGGGGTQLADMMRAQGAIVRTVAFGEAVNIEMRRNPVLFTERKDLIEERYNYKNRRVQMYHLLSMLLDPIGNPNGFGLPGCYGELRRQLSPFPKKWDEEGRLYLPPKHKKDRDSTTQCLADIIGCSPDEADSLVLAVFIMTYPEKKLRAGSLFSSLPSY